MLDLTDDEIEILRDHLRAGAEDELNGNQKDYDEFHDHLDEKEKWGAFEDEAFGGESGDVAYFLEQNSDIAKFTEDYIDTVLRESYKNNELYKKLESYTNNQTVEAINIIRQMTMYLQDRSEDNKILNSFDIREHGTGSFIEQMLSDLNQDLEEALADKAFAYKRLLTDIVFIEKKLTQEKEKKIEALFSNIRGLFSDAPNAENEIKTFIKNLGKLLSEAGKVESFIAFLEKKLLHFSPNFKEALKEKNSEYHKFIAESFSKKSSYRTNPNLRKALNVKGIEYKSFILISLTKSSSYNFNNYNLKEVEDTFKAQHEESKVKLFIKKSLSNLNRNLKEAIEDKRSEYEKFITDLILTHKMHAMENVEEEKKALFSKLEELLLDAPDAVNVIIDSQGYYFDCKEIYDRKITYKEDTLSSEIKRKKAYNNKNNVAENNNTRRFSTSIVKEVESALAEFDFYVDHVLKTFRQNSDSFSGYTNCILLALLELDEILQDGLLPNGKLNKDHLPNTLFTSQALTITIFLGLEEFRKAAENFVSKYETADKVIKAIKEHERFVIFLLENADSKIGGAYKKYKPRLLNLFGKQVSKIIQRKRTILKSGGKLPSIGYKTIINQTHLTRRCMRLRNDEKLIDFYTTLNSFRFHAKNWAHTDLKRKRISKNNVSLLVRKNDKKRTNSEEGDPKMEKENQKIQEGDQAPFLLPFTV